MIDGDGEVCRVELSADCDMSAWNNADLRAVRHHSEN